jgi:hypothetical protein
MHFGMHAFLDFKNWMEINPFIGSSSFEFLNIIKKHDVYAYWIFYCLSKSDKN